jgi:hypothetical protein
MANKESENLENLDEMSIAESAGLGPEWKPVDAAPIRPGTPPLPNDVAPYYGGSIAPSLQHPANFENTRYHSPLVPVLPLMPLGVSASPVTNSASQSVTAGPINSAGAQAALTAVGKALPGTVSGTTVTAATLQNIANGSTRFAQTGSGLTYRATTDPLTATTTTTGSPAVSSSTISIAPFTIQTSSEGNFSVNSGTISLLLPSTLYYIYFDDASLAGGTETFKASASQITALTGSGRFFIGSITTPAPGAVSTVGNNNGSGSGVSIGSSTTYLFGATSTSGTSGGDAQVLNPNNAIDGNYVDFATVEITSASATAEQVTLTLNGASPTSAPWTGLTLHVLSAVPVNTVNPGASPASISYSLDGGNSYTTLWTVGPATTRPLTTDSVSLPLSQNLALVYIQATCFRHSGATQPVTLNVYEAWITATL